MQEQKTVILYQTHSLHTSLEYTGNLDQISDKTPTLTSWCQKIWTFCGVWLLRPLLVRPLALSPPVPG